MNFSELKDELFARGTDYLEEDAAGIARAERWINQAYRRILNLQAWPFLQAVATGPAGEGYVQINDLRKIRYVVDLTNGPTSGRPLSRRTREDLTLAGEDVDIEGTPESYFVEQGIFVQGWPRGGTIQVYYVKRVDPLTGTDSPLFDEEYHDIIIDLAMMKAYKDSDNFEALAATKQEAKEALDAMVNDYMLDSRDVQFIDVYPYDG